MPSPGGEGLVCPLQEGRVWCALSRRGGSGVPSPGGEGLVCPPLLIIFLLCYSYCYSFHQGSSARNKASRMTGHLVAHIFDPGFTCSFMSRQITYLT